MDSDTPKATRSHTQAQNIREILARVEAIEDEQMKLSAQLNIVAKSINGVDVKAMNESIRRIQEIVDGDETKDIVGLRNRAKTTETAVKELAEERNKIRWILVGVSLSGIANLGTLISIILKALGGM